MSATGLSKCSFDNVKNYAILRPLALPQFETKIEMEEQTTWKYYLL